jgi:photosystem II stability/assembly factor-like uncharacterized protein
MRSIFAFSSLFFRWQRSSAIKTIYVLILLLLNTSAFSQSGWYQVTDTNADKYVSTIQFTSANTGYAAISSWGVGEFLKTTNGGLNWQRTQYPGRSIDDTYFLDNNTGFLISWKEGYSSILKTTNGGNNWAMKDSIYGIFKHRIHCCEVQSGL